MARLISMRCTVFFFFQAEDGIRDLTVTGVQTCALPIWRAGDGGGGCHVVGFEYLADHLEGPASAGPSCADPGRQPGSDLRRSEERRVGKECRSRWSPYH